MDLIVRDRNIGRPLWVLPPAPDTGYLAVKLTERLWRPDTIEIEIDARVARDAGVVKGRLIEAAGLIFLVEQIHISTDQESRVSALASITGFDPVTVPRAIQPTSGQSHDVQTSVAGETAMKHYVSRNIGPDASSDRSWNLLVIEADQERGKSGSWRGRYQSLVDMTELISQQTGIGYRTVWDSGFVSEEGFEFGRAVFRTILGTSRDRLLAVSEGTAENEELLISDSEARNKAYVGGEGEGVSRQIIQRHAGIDEPKELNRREMFLDASDTDATAALESRGDAELAKLESADSAEVEVNEFPGWMYSEHFDLGDTLSYRSSWVEDRLVRIVEVETTWRESLAAPSRVLTLDHPFPDISDRDSVSGGTEFA